MTNHPDPLGGGLIAIVRGRAAEHLDAALDALRRARARFGADIALGAGTVRGVDAARAALDAGAGYLVSPHTDPSIGEVAKAAGAAWLPGALTPTEIVAAWTAGADAVKLFPARLGGPRYLKDLREPLDDIPIVPTGGITAQSIVDWFAAGASAVGAGGPLMGDALSTGDLAGLRERALVMVDALGAVRR